MALSYSPVDIRGLAVSPILEQVFSQIKLFQMVMLLSMTTKQNTILQKQEFLLQHNFIQVLH
jgi:hypothetical protein